MMVWPFDPRAADDVTNRLPQVSLLSREVIVLEPITRWRVTTFHALFRTVLLNPIRPWGRQPHFGTERRGRAPTIRRDLGQRRSRPGVGGGLRRRQGDR